MRKLLAAAAVVALAAPPLALAVAKTPPPKDDTAALYRAKCAFCHGDDGKPTPAGQRRGTPDLAGATRLQEKAIVAEITNGKAKMPAFKGLLTAKQIRVLARYVKSGLK